MAAKGLNRRGMAEVETKYLQAVSPFCEVRLGGVALRRIAREAGRDDEMRARAEELDACLIPDFDAATREQGDPACEVRELAPLEEIQLRANRAELVVKVMDPRVILFADIAILRFENLFEIGVRRLGLRVGGGRRQVRCGKDRFAAQFADAGLVEHFVIGLALAGLSFAPAFLCQGAAVGVVRLVNLAGGLQQAGALLAGELREKGAVGDD